MSVKMFILMPMLMFPSVFMFLLNVSKVKNVGLHKRFFTNAPHKQTNRVTAETSSASDFGDQLTF